ncbi:hypothetical protein GG681_02575 [Epibacterium sp. SM1969]|uniref:Uncharacterized protein n=1 Tax=Tritonibacter aquimaris TaxID=2663379 RepID=A0A844AUA3_9RHOB|nr:hypothetical protein [Tritonibacter aquimaris]MQY41512.1 hypothetical protein [Tritonibacter aquimaris]
MDRPIDETQDAERLKLLKHARSCSNLSLDFWEDLTRDLPLEIVKVVAARAEEVSDFIQERSEG